MNKLPRRGPGQPTAYKPKYCETAKRLIARGATTVDLAFHFDDDVRTIDRWVAGIPAFREAVEAARCDPAHLRGLIIPLEQQSERWPCAGASRRYCRQRCRPSPAVGR
jgi:hypothetical protein